MLRSRFSLAQADACDIVFRKAQRGEIFARDKIDEAFYHRLKLLLLRAFVWRFAGDSMSN
jgi:hypothetical protein